MKIKFLLVVGVFGFSYPLIALSNPYLFPQKTIIANGASSREEGRDGVEFLSYRKKVSGAVIEETSKEIAGLKKIPDMLNLCNVYKLQIQNFFTSKNNTAELTLQNYGGVNNIVSCIFIMRVNGMPTKSVLTSEIQGKKLYQVYIWE